MAVHPRNKLNELSASEWINHTVSVLVQKGLGQNSIHAKYERLHPAPFSFQDISRFIAFFSKSGEFVFDPFVGVGSTLKAAALLGRRSAGVEINPYFVKLARERLRTELPSELNGRQIYEVIEGDIRAVIDNIQNHSIDFLVTSPPYWGILDKIDHKARAERLMNGYSHNYGDIPGDLSKIGDYNDFVSSVADIFGTLKLKVRNKGYAVIVVGDFRHKSKYFMYHADLAHKLANRGWLLQGITILYQKHKKVYPYGYPYSFVPNIHHQYALILRNDDV